MPRESSLHAVLAALTLSVAKHVAAGPAAPPRSTRPGSPGTTHPTTADPKAAQRPRRVLLHMEDGRVVDHTSLQSMPDWATPILAAAFDLVARIATVAALTTAARYRDALPDSPATLRGAGR